MLRSFLPPGGAIVRVSVYPSDFGLARMKEEEEHGPRAAFADEEDNRRARDAQRSAALPDAGVRARSSETL